MAISILGIDPGFAALGVARLTMNTGAELCIDGIRVVTTTPARKKERCALRASADDVRRARKLWDGMHELADGVHAVAYEVYQPFPGTAASGAKVANACGLAQALGFSLAVPVIAVSPADVKREAVGRLSASKADVQAALCERVPRLAELLEGLSKTRREHASDATAVALVGLDEVLRWRTVSGID